MGVRFMTKMQTGMAGLGLCGLLLLTGCRTVVVARPGPPPPPRAVVVVPGAPWPGAVWVRGHYIWQPRWGRYRWVPGHWVR